jgi:hypothetical protein
MPAEQRAGDHEMTHHPQDSREGVAKIANWANACLACSVAATKT